MCPPSPPQEETSSRPARWKLQIRQKARHWLDGWLRPLAETLQYLAGRDATILLSAVSFSFLISIFPFIVLLLAASQALAWNELRETIFDAFYHFFPISQDFIIRNLKIYTQGVGRMHVVSVILLVFGISAFFFSLEAALDSAYKVPAYRRFLRSQVLGSTLTLVVGVVVFLGLALLRGVRVLSRRWIASRTGYRETLEWGAGLFVYLGITFVLFFILYYFLPNRRRLAGRILPEVFFSSILWSLGNHLFRSLAPSWSLQPIYGPFYVSVTLLLWAYLFGIVLLAGARLSAHGFFGNPPPNA